jgi:fatty acid desaturase
MYVTRLIWTTKYWRDEATACSYMLLCWTSISNKFILICIFQEWIIYIFTYTWWTGLFRRYSDWLRAGRSGDQIPVGARFFAHVQTGPGAHPASCTMGTGSFPGVKRPGRGADHPFLLAPRSRMSRTIPLLPFWALRGLYGVTFTFYIHVCCRSFSPVPPGCGCFSQGTT